MTHIFEVCIRTLADAEINELLIACSCGEHQDRIASVRVSIVNRKPAINYGFDFRALACACVLEAKELFLSCNSVSLTFARGITMRLSAQSMTSMHDRHPPEPSTRAALSSPTILASKYWQFLHIH